MRGRILVIAVALVLGAVAALAAWSYLSAVRREADAGGQMVEVLVATKDIPRGASAEQLLKDGSVKLAKVPQRYVASGAFSSVKSVADRVLAVPVSKGEVLTTNRFQYPSQAGLALTVPKDFVAVTIPVDEARGLAALVKPGDRVAVIATVGSGSGKDDRTRIIVAGTQVLAVGRSTGADKDTSKTQQQQGGALTGQQQNQVQPMANVTLAVSPFDAEKIVFAAEVGNVWLALLPATQSAAQPGPGQTSSSVLE